MQLHVVEVELVFLILVLKDHIYGFSKICVNIYFKVVFAVVKNKYQHLHFNHIHFIFSLLLQRDVVVYVLTYLKYIYIFK